MCSLLVKPVSENKLGDYVLLEPIHLTALLAVHITRAAGWTMYMYIISTPGAHCLELRFSPISDICYLHFNNSFQTIDHTEDIITHTYITKVNK